MRILLLLTVLLITYNQLPAQGTKHYQGGRQIDFGFSDDIDYEHQGSYLHNSFSENALIVYRNWDLNRPGLKGLKTNRKLAHTILGQIPEWSHAPLHVEKVDGPKAMDKVRTLNEQIRYMVEDIYADIYTDAGLVNTMPEKQIEQLLSSQITSIESTEAWYFNAYTHRFEPRMLYLKFTNNKGTAGYMEYSQFMQAIANEYYTFALCPAKRYVKLPVHNIYYYSGRCPACQALHKEFWDKGSFFYRKRGLAEITKIEKCYGQISDPEFFCESDAYFELNLMAEAISLTKQPEDDGFETENENGESISGSYSNGLANGEWAWQYANGQNRLETIYREGQPDGSFKLYYPDGTLKEEGTFYRGERTGTWRSYWPNGKLLSKRTYENGLPYGSYILYHDNGNIYASIYYEKGLKKGAFKLWAVDGDELENCNYLLDRLYGYATFSTLKIKDKKQREKLFEQMPGQFETYANGQYSFRTIFGYELHYQTIEAYQVCGEENEEGKKVLAEAETTTNSPPEQSSEENLVLKLNLRTAEDKPLDQVYNISIEEKNGATKELSPQTSYPDIELELNTEYTIHLSAGHNASAKITIDTQLPENTLAENIHKEILISLCLSPLAQGETGEALMHIEYSPLLLGFGADPYHLIKGAGNYGLLLSW